MLRACTICKQLTATKKCQLCKNSDLTEEWSGIIVVFNPEKSKLSRKLNVKNPGMYAQYCLTYNK